LGCGANLAKQFVAINNTGHKLATVHIPIVNFTVVNVSVIHLTQSIDDSRHQLKHDPDHHYPNYADLKR
jgi:hypothetical protein